MTALSAPDLLAENARLREALLNLLHAAIEAGVCDDIALTVFPDMRKPNGQPVSDITKAARRAVNEARAALGDRT